ncbi:hypothetical protein F4Y19_21370 [Candidatus Poribacteria bacterium]|nr:hypothetical protein [Candidatus Poribacteria bacterium]
MKNRTYDVTYESIIGCKVDKLIPIISTNSVVCSEPDEAALVLKNGRNSVARESISSCEVNKSAVIVLAESLAWA